MPNFPERSQLPTEKIIYRPHQRGNGQFFEHLSLTKEQSDQLKQEIAQIAISHQLDETTLKIPAGAQVKQIMVIKISLNGERLDTGLLKALDQRLGFHILFDVQSSQGDHRWTMAYKEVSSSPQANNLYKVFNYFKVADLPDLPYHAVDLDDFYQKLLKQMGQEHLKVDDKDMAQAIQKTQDIEKLEKKAQQLKKKMYTAKSMRQQMDYKKAYQQVLADIDALKKG